jgi:hypothetical protein
VPPTPCLIRFRVSTEPAALVAIEAAIRQVLYRYCRGADRCDRELIASCFVPGAPVEYVGVHQGTIETFIDHVLASHARMRAHHHMIGNVLLEVTDGPLVTSETYGSIAMWKAVGDGVSELLYRNRYLDRWTQQDGRWLISERLHVIDQLTVDGQPDVAGLASRPGRNDVSDFSYQFLHGRRTVPRT